MRVNSALPSLYRNNGLILRMILKVMDQQKRPYFWKEGVDRPKAGSKFYHSPRQIKSLQI